MCNLKSSKSDLSSIKSLPLLLSFKKSGSVKAKSEHLLNVPSYPNLLHVFSHCTYGRHIRFSNTGSTNWCFKLAFFILSEGIYHFPINSTSVLYMFKHPTWNNLYQTKCSLNCCTKNTRLRFHDESADTQSGKRQIYCSEFWGIDQKHPSLIDGDTLNRFQWILISSVGPFGLNRYRSISIFLEPLSHICLLFSLETTLYHYFSAPRYQN